MKYLLKYKLFLFLFILISLLVSCSSEVYNKKYYVANSSNFFALPPLSPNFIICSGFFTSQVELNYQANLTCSTQNKKAVFVNKRYFQTCYFFKPVASIYQCV